MFKELNEKLEKYLEDIEIRHEGILEVPENKKVDELPKSHFLKLYKEKGGEITKALNNLVVWNKNKNPKLSSWASSIIDYLKSHS